MLLQQEREQISSAGLGEGNQFTIAAGAKAFEVLSSNLYQNKTLAVIREITCNAVDAHRVVGKAVSEIEIHMPTYVEPHFSVRDYGPGLSHEDVLSLYTTYFRSTKDQSNDMIGGFGLGSKSPFAVADQFTVTSWFGGEERRYVCYKVAGVPAINHVSTVASERACGLEVQVAVNSGTMYRWEDSARDLFKWWPELPRGLKTIEYALSNVYCTVRSPKDVSGGYPEWSITGYVSQPTVLMGGVPYSLNFEAIAGLPPDYIHAFSNLGLVLAFEVGDLNISPSREALSYDPATCRKLAERLRHIYKEAQAEIENHVNALPSLWEARQYLYGPGGVTQKGGLFQKIKTNLMGIQWQGKPVQQVVRLNLQQDFSNPVVISSKTKAGHRKSWHAGVAQEAWDFAHAIKGNVVTWLWTGAITSKTYSKGMYASEQEVPHIVDKWGNKQQPDRVVAVVSGVPFAEVEKVFAERGMPPLRKVDDLPDVPKSTSLSSKQRPTTKAYLYDLLKKEWRRTEQTVDLTTPGLYVEFYDGKPSGLPEYHMRNYIRLGVIDTALPIIGVPRNRLGVRLTAALDKAGWCRGDMTLVQRVPLADVKAEALRHTMLERFSGNTEMLKFLSGMAASLPTPLADAVASVTKYYKRRDYTAAAVLEYQAQFSDVQKAEVVAAQQEVDGILAEFDAAIEKHPLLARLVYDSRLDAAAVLDYINR